jgi:lysophospholipid acyltransferase (LPLAT)-like uncharacterized protein
MQASAERRNNLRRTNGERQDSFERYYTFVSLSAYPFKKRLLIRLADLVFYLLINLVGLTTRYEIKGWEHYERVKREGFAGIHTLWHDCIYLAIYFWKRRGIVYMTSQSFDGEYIARFLQRFGFGAARGSSTRGGIGAMIEMARLLRAGIPVGFTVDGPKGPRRVAKMGAVLLAKKTGQPILPFNVTARRFWQAPSWDKFEVPMPFSRAFLEIAEPVYVPTDADDAMLQAKLVELQSKMDELNRRGEEWRA